MKSPRRNSVSSLMQWLAFLTVVVPTISVFGQDVFPFYKYAIYYNDLIEFTWCGPMTINGVVRGNGNMYTGSQYQLTFNGKVEIAGTISSPAWSGKTPGEYTVPVKYNGFYVTNAPYWTLPIGTDGSTNGYRQILEPPPPGGDTIQGLAWTRYYNVAQVALLVSNTTITAIIKRAIFDTTSNVMVAAYYPTNNNASNYLAVTARFPFLSVTNYWATNPVPVTDQRENAVLRLTDIDIGVLKQWLYTNTTIKAMFPSADGVFSNACAFMPNTLYVADNRSYATGHLVAVRLKNASLIPTNLFTRGGSNVPSGFAVATPNPLYIYGNYNCPNSAHLNTRDTSATYPALLVCDALTILSTNWQDSQSALLLSNPGKAKAVSTTVNAAIIAGIVYSTGPGADQYSGGVPNFPRLLEDWGSNSLTLNTALINVFHSERATNQWRPAGQYYFSPARQYNYDTNLQVTWKWPPGTPGFFPGTPHIETEPQSQRVGAGRPAIFAATVAGTGPIRYQWSHLPAGKPFGANDIPGETNSTLTILSVDQTNAGIYFITATNGYGITGSTGAVLSIGIPPSIVVQPLGQAALRSGVASFTVRANGEAPLSYQWRLNETALLNGTNTSLVVSNVQAALTGDYTVVVSNPAGSETSSIAHLSLANSPDTLWGTSFHTTDSSGSSRVDSMAVDPSGHVFVAGSFSGRTMDFGGQTLTNSYWAPGASANFLCKYSTAGLLLWAYPLGTNSGSAYPLRVVADPWGNACVACRFSGSFFTLDRTVQLASYGPADQLIVRINALGSLYWAQRINHMQGVTPPAPYSLALSGGNVIISGQYTNSVYHYSGFALTNGGSFIAVLPFDIGLSVEARASAFDVVAGDALAVGTNGNFYVAGTPGLLAEYGANGSLLWSKPFPIGSAMMADSRQNIYVTGWGAGIYDGFALTNTGGGPDFFLARCDSAGQLQWMRQLGSVRQQRGNSIALDPFNNVWVTSTSATGLPDPTIQFGGTVLSNAFALAAKYDPAGNPLWAQSLTSTARSAMLALAVNDSTNTFVGGAFSGRASIGRLSLPGTYEPPPGWPQMFFAKLFGPVAYGPIEITAQPQNQVVLRGSNASFSITADSPLLLGYQWFHNSTNAILGATNSSLLLPNAQTSDSGSYSVVVSNLYGVTNSAMATLTCAVPPEITTPPLDLLLLAGQNALFTITADGTEPLIYQWKFNGDNVPDATTGSLTLTNISPEQAGQYIVIVSNLFGAATNAATLSVYTAAAASLTALPLLGSGQFQFTVSGVPNFTYVIETSTNFLDWEPLLTNKSPFTLTDNQATNFPARFYRATYVP